MDIAFFGASLVSSYGNGAATYYRGLLRALADRGHRVAFYEPDALSRQAHRDIDDPDWAKVVVYPADRDAALRAIESARGADLVVKASGVGVFDELLAEAVLELKSPHTRVAFWDVDAPATLERVRNDSSDPLRALLPRYDLVFTYGGGPPVVSAYETLGAAACVPIYNALDPATHRPEPPRAAFFGDLGFLGNRLPDRELRVDEFLFRAARALPRHQFVLAGSGWDEADVPRNVRRVGHIGTADHNAFNASCRAVLNVTRERMAAMGYAPPTRLFGAAGAGACLLTDRWEGLSEFLEPGEEVIAVEGGDEVAEELGRLGSREARRIGDRARARVLAQHTYGHRARDVEAALGEPDPSAAAHPRPATARRGPSIRGGGSALSIAIVGLSITSSWGNHHATTYRSLIRELARLGHRVVFYEQDIPRHAKHRDLSTPPYCETRLYRDPDELQARYGDEIAGADAAIAGSGIERGVAVGRWLQRAVRGVVGFYDIDTPVTRAALANGTCSYLEPDLIPGYDVYLSYAGGPMLEEIERRFGARRVAALYCSADPDIYFPDEGAAEVYDLGYIGTYAPDRQPGVDELLLAPARRCPDETFILAGPQYPDAIDWPRNLTRREYVPPMEHRAFYCQQRFTLNLTRPHMIDAGYSPSVRLFEAAACGTPIITDAWRGLDEFFDPGSEILVAHSADDVVHSLQTLRERERRAIGTRARRRVLREHTAAHRAARLESILHKTIASRAAA